jgi:hypothetical protein
MNDHQFAGRSHSVCPWLHTGKLRGHNKPAQWTLGVRHNYCDSTFDYFEEEGLAMAWSLSEECIFFSVPGFVLWRLQFTNIVVHTSRRRVGNQCIPVRLCSQMICYRSPLIFATEKNRTTRSTLLQQYLIRQPVTINGNSAFSESLKLHFSFLGKHDLSFWSIVKVK